MRKSVKFSPEVEQRVGRNAGVYLLVDGAAPAGRCNAGKL
jgi:hypothetical protein